jgi:ketosteroid isomerase-like protein
MGVGQPQRDQRRASVKESVMAETTFETFWTDRTQAAQAYVRGDGGKLDALVPHDGNASFHSPRGDTVVGAPDVASRYLSDAKSFHSNGTTQLEVIQRACDGDLGFWTGIQIAQVQIGDASHAVQMRIRVTEVFRKIDGEWRLIHRHADIPPTS